MLITLFGKPGSGKTTFGDFLESRHGCVHLPLSRFLKDQKFLATIGISPDGMAAAFSSGRTISSVPLFDWLDCRILEEKSSVVVDGYPREPAALARFNALARRLIGTTDVVALKLSCSREVALQRTVARAREGDTPALINARINDYVRVQRPLFNQLHPSIRRLETQSTDLAAIAAMVLSGDKAR